MPSWQGKTSPPEFVMEAYASDLTPDEFHAIRLLFALRNAVQRVNSDLAGWLGPDALSPGRMQLLMILRAKKGPVLQRDLVTLLGISRSSVSELVELLSRDGLVVTSPDTTHGRRMHVTLTPHGQEVSERQIRENARRLATLLGLSEPEKRDLVDRLEALARQAETDTAS